MSMFMTIFWGENPLLYTEICMVQVFKIKNPVNNVSKTAQVT